MNKKTILKTLVIGLLMTLVISSITPSASTQIKQITNIKPLSMRNWSDNFDSYENGQFLDGGPDDGGWKGWDNDPAAGAYVTDTQSLSAPHSVEIKGATDLVHEYTGCTAGQWTYIAWQYIPDDFVGQTYFILLSDYTDGAGQGNQWAVQIRFDSSLQVAESEYDSVNLPLITGRWVELRVEINLDTDWFEFYYDGNLLIEKAWTAGPNNQGTGYKVIDAVDLYANGASPVYYDDLSLEGEAPPAGDLDCDGSLNWEKVKAGSTVTGDFQVGNVGDEGTLINWEIASYPTWGTWTFSQTNGTDLAAGDWITINVSVVAPPDKKKEFTGKVKIINSDNPADFCEIDVYLKTPRTRTNYLLQNLLARFPNAFPVLRYLLNI
ncbi:MAG: hypothetical protein ACQXXF_06690 [Thermoplasmatota archaeon]|jgi:hypothetical protein